jgi:hypothetical protein
MRNLEFQSQSLDLKREEERELAKSLKRGEIIKNLEGIKERRYESIAKMREETSKLKNNTVLFTKIQNKYQSEILIPELEMKKQRLSEIRELHQPIDGKELSQHARKYSLMM